MSNPIKDHLPAAVFEALHDKYQSSITEGYIPGNAFKVTFVEEEDRVRFNVEDFGLSLCFFFRKGLMMELISYKTEIGEDDQPKRIERRGSFAQLKPDEITATTARTAEMIVKKLQWYH